MAKKFLDTKLAAIRSGAYNPADFIIADAKDGDIAFGVTAPGPEPDRPGRFKLRAAHLEAIREMTVGGYHDGLARAGIEPAIPLYRDRKITEAVLRD
jgi:hypothetical protein